MTPDMAGLTGSGAVCIENTTSRKGAKNAKGLLAPAFLASFAS